MAWQLRWFRDFVDADDAGMPVGAIWREHGHLFVATPAGLADITTWDITGPDARLTVSPSILNRGGGNGLTYDCEGRTFMPPFLPDAPEVPEGA